MISLSIAGIPNLQDLVPDDLRWNSEIKSTVNVMCLNHPQTIAPHCLWKNCLPWNGSLVPKRLRTAGIGIVLCPLLTFFLKQYCMDSTTITAEVMVFCGLPGEDVWNIFPRLNALGLHVPLLLWHVQLFLRYVVSTPTTRILSTLVWLFFYFCLWCLWCVLFLCNAQQFLFYLGIYPVVSALWKLCGVF